MIFFLLLINTTRGSNILKEQSMTQNHINFTIFLICSIHLHIFLNALKKLIFSELHGTVFKLKEDYISEYTCLLLEFKFYGDVQGLVLLERHSIREEGAQFVSWTYLITINFIINLKDIFPQIFAKNFDFSKSRYYGTLKKHQIWKNFMSKCLYNSYSLYHLSL